VHGVHLHLRLLAESRKQNKKQKARTHDARYYYYLFLKFQDCVFGVFLIIPRGVPVPKSKINRQITEITETRHNHQKEAQ
jgi:hypothetical protein